MTSSTCRINTSVWGPLVVWTDSRTVLLEVVPKARQLTTSAKERANMLVDYTAIRHNTLQTARPMRVPDLGVHWRAIHRCLVTSVGRRLEWERCLLRPVAIHHRRGGVLGSLERLCGFNVCDDSRQSSRASSNWFAVSSLVGNNHYWLTRPMTRCRNPYRVRCVVGARARTRATVEE